MKNIQKKLTGCTVAILGSMLMNATLPSGDPADLGAREIMERTMDQSSFVGLEAVSTLRIFDARGRERIRQTKMASREFGNGTEKRIIRFLSPAEVRGTGMLIYDYREKNDDMWIFMPALRKTRRIVSGEKSKSFMGSEFSNADMTAPNLDDFRFTLLDPETFEGTPCWVVEAIPVSEEVMEEMGFDRKVSWIGKSDYIPRKAEYYNEEGELFKRLTAREVRLVEGTEGKSLARFMEIQNLENGRHSVMTMDKIQYNPGVPEKYFTLSYLEKY